MSDRSVDDILAELEPDRFASKPTPAPVPSSQRSVDDIVAELEAGPASAVDTRRPNVGMDDLDRSDLLGAGMDLGAAVESTSLQQGASPEDALRRRLEAEQTTMVLGPRADSGSVRRALEAREGQDSPGKAAQRALGQGLVPLPPAARTSVERDDEARRREREFREFREMGVIGSLKRAWAGNPDEQVPVENEVAADKLWLQRAKDDAGKVVLSSLTAGTYPLIRLALQKAGLGEYDLTPDATGGMESWSSLVEGLSGDEDVQALATPEAAGALSIKTLQASGIGPIVGKAAGAVEAALPDPLVKAAEEVGFDIGTTALFWDDVQPREKFDAAAQLFYETGDRSEVDGLTLRDLPARARGDSVDVAAFLRMANAGDPDLAFLNTIADKDERYLAAQIERLPLSVVGRTQPSLVPDTDALRDIHVRRTNAKEYAGDAEADSLLRLMGAGLVRPVDNGENLLFVPGRMMEAMRLAGVPLAALNEIEVNPYRALAGVLGGPMVYPNFPDAPEPGDTSLAAKVKAARVPTGAGLQSMAASGAFNDWLEWAGLDGGERFASLYEPGSTWESRTLTATMLPEYQFRLLKDTYTRAGGDPGSGTADVLGAADLLANFLIPAEEIAIAPVMSAARARMRARAASGAARELGMAGREARAAATAAALSGDGLQSGGEALRRQAVELLESGQYDPDNLSVGARKNLLTVFQQAEVENPEQFLEKLLDTLRDRRARVLDENAAVIVEGGLQTQALRGSEPYKRVAAELDGLVRTGNLTPADRDLTLRIEEAKALNAWDEGEIGSPEEWFASQEWRKGVEGDLANPDPRTLYSGEGDAPAPRTRADVEASPEFRNWFGDSKVVDAEGRPLVVYHGTVNDFSAFSPAKLGETTGAPSAQSAFFFTSDADTASDYADVGDGRLARRLNAEQARLERIAQRTQRNSDWERYYRAYEQYENHVLNEDPSIGNEGANVLPVYLSMKNPLVKDFGGAEYREESYYDLIQEAKRRGHDGVIFKNTIDPGSPNNRNVIDVYAVLSPAQIKSATGNRGTFDPNNPSILYSEEGGRVAGSIERMPERPLAPTYYSALRRAVENLKGDKFGADQLRAALRNTPGVKADEIEWTGLDRFLAGKKSVTKAEALAWLDENGVVVEERVLRDLTPEQMRNAPDPYAAATYGRQTQYSNYTLPGGTNYREVLFKMPGDAGYQAPHFGPEGENLLAHVRLNDRTGPNGERILFVEEVQSDWHQAGREKGYKGLSAQEQARKAELDAKPMREWSDADTDWYNEAVNDRQRDGVPDAPFAKTWPDLVMKRILRMAAEGGYDGVAWTPGIVQVKRYEDATRAAVDEIRWQRSGDRVSLVGYKNGVEVYSDDVPRNKVADVVGKEIARKIEEAPSESGPFRVEEYDDWGDTVYRVIDTENDGEVVGVHRDRADADQEAGELNGGYEYDGASGTVTGSDLTVGGEGMKGFYDRMLPNIVRDLPAVKKAGGRAGKIDLPTGGRGSGFFARVEEDVGELTPFRVMDGEDRIGPYFATREEAERFAAETNAKRAESVPYLPLTPKIRDAVLYEGQPLFQRVANTVRGFIQPNNTTSRWLIRLFQTGDIRTAFHEGGHLQALMRPGWEARAAKVFDSVNGRLTREGHEQLADAVTRLLRGTFRPGSRTDNLAADVLDTLGDAWARVRDLPIVSRLQGSVLDRLPKPIPPEFARLWDETFRPHVRTRPVAARLVDERQPRGMRAPAFVPGDMDARLAASKKRAVGTAEEAQRVDRAPAEIRAALGLRQGQDAVDPIDLLANALAYIGTERMRRSWGFGELVPLTNRVAVPAARKEAILSEWNARRMAALGGKEPTPDGTDLLFDANQQAGLRRLIYEAEDSPLGEILPASLTDENADLSRVATEDYNRLMDIHKEIRAGMGAFRNARAEQAAVSGAIRLLGKAAAGLERTDAAPILRKIKEMFSTSHVSEEYLGPAARDLIKAVERELAEVPSQIKREIIEVAEAWRKQGRDFKAVDLIRDLSYGVGPEVVPVDELGRLLRLNELTAAPDLARVVADLDEIDALFTNAPLTNAAEQVATESMAIAHLDQIARAMNDIDGISFEEAVRAVGLTPEQANDAMGIVVEGLRRRFASFENSAVDILISLTGTDDVAILDAIKHAPTRHAKLQAVYDAWYTGRWDAALDEVGRMGYATGGPSFDQGSAALTALLRLRSRQVLGQLAYRLADAGLTGDVTKLARGGVRYDRPYVLGAKPDGREAFLEDVAGYISAITGWADRPEYRLPVFDADGVEVQPGHYLAAEGELTKRGVVNKDAYAEAVRVLSMWGFKTGKGTDWTPIDLPGGARVMVPNLIREPLEEVVSRASPQSIAFRVGSAAERIGDITPGASATGAPGVAVKGINAAMRILQGMWDYSYGMLRTGLLTGIGPFVRPAYYVGNAFGGFMQLLQGVGTLGTAKVLGGAAADFGAVRRIVQRMYRDGTGIGGVNMLSPAERGFFTRDGRYFTDSMIANMANRAGLNSSLPKSEFAESLIETIRREEPTWWNNLQRLPWPGSRAWREHLNEGATAIDNFYRIATFMDGLKRGLSDAEAAALARRVAFDYNDLTDFERQFARRTIMFYTFFRRNQDLFWWTFLNHPERVAAQLRLMGGLQREALETENEIYVPDWMDDRVPFLFRDALKEGHATNAQAGRMTITPGIPIPVALSLWLDLYGAAGQPLVDLALGDAPTKDERAIAGLVGLATPIVQLPFVAATGVDPDSGRELTPTAVPALLAEPFAELDDALTGGLVMRDMFGLRKVNPWDDASAARPGAPVWQVQGEGPLLAWWAFNNMTPAGPVLNQATQYDRAIPGGLNEPRVGLTEMDEAATIAGARTSTVPRREIVLGREGERREKEINALRRDALRGDITKGE